MWVYVRLHGEVCVFTVEGGRDEGQETLSLPTKTRSKCLLLLIQLAYKRQHKDLSHQISGRLYYS